jgi:MFS family permease
VGTGPCLAGGLTAAAYVGMILAPGTLVTFTMWLAVAGLGSGLVSGTLPILVVQRAAADSVGIASGLYNTARTAAGGVAGALFALLMAALTTPTAAGTRVKDVPRVDSARRVVAIDDDDRPGPFSDLRLDVGHVWPPIVLLIVGVVHRFAPRASRKQSGTVR